MTRLSTVLHILMACTTTAYASLCSDIFISTSSVSCDLTMRDGDLYLKDTFSDDTELIIVDMGDKTILSSELTLNCFNVRDLNLTLSRDTKLTVKVEQDMALKVVGGDSFKYRMSHLNTEASYIPSNYPINVKNVGRTITTKNDLDSLEIDDFNIDLVISSSRRTNLNYLYLEDGVNLDIKGILDIDDMFVRGVKSSITAKDECEIDNLFMTYMIDIDGCNVDNVMVTNLKRYTDKVINTNGFINYLKAAKFLGHKSILPERYRIYTNTMPEVIKVLGNVGVRIKYTNSSWMENIYINNDIMNYTNSFIRGWPFQGINIEHGDKTIVTEKGGGVIRAVTRGPSIFAYLGVTGSIIFLSSIGVFFFGVMGFVIYQTYNKSKRD